VNPKSFFLLVVLFFVSGCAATQVALSKRDLDVQTRLSDSIFLDPVSEDKMTIYIKVRNTSDKTNFDLEGAIKAAMQAKGYKVTTNPDAAHYTLLANVLSVEKSRPTAAETLLSAGYGGAIGGAAGGAIAGAASHGSSGAPYGASTGAMVSGGAEAIAGSLVYDIVYSVIADVELRERTEKDVTVRQNQQQEHQQGIGGARGQTSSEVTNYRSYRTRVVSTANKVGLDYEEAAPLLSDGLARSLAGLFGLTNSIPRGLFGI